MASAVRERTAKNARRIVIELRIKRLEVGGLEVVFIPSTKWSACYID